MKVYEFSPPEKFELVHPLDDEGWEAFRQLDGTPSSRTWRPIPVRLVKRGEHGRPYAQSDMPWLGSWIVLVLRERVLVALWEVLEGYGEFLPLACEEAVEAARAAELRGVGFKLLWEGSLPGAPNGRAEAGRSPGEVVEGRVGGEPRVRPGARRGRAVLGRWGGRPWSSEVRRRLSVGPFRRGRSAGR